MAAYRQVYDSRRLQADCQEPGSARSAIEYGLQLHLYMLLAGDNGSRSSRRAAGASARLD